MVIGRVKAIKELFLTKLDTLLSQQMELIHNIQELLLQRFGAVIAKTNIIITRQAEMRQLVNTLVAQQTNTQTLIQALITQQTETQHLVNAALETSKDTTRNDASLLEFAIHAIEGQQQVQLKLSSLEELQSNAKRQQQALAALKQQQATLLEKLTALGASGQSTLQEQSTGFRELEQKLAQQFHQLEQQTLLLNKLEALQDQNQSFSELHQKLDTFLTHQGEKFDQFSTQQTDLVHNVDQQLTHLLKQQPIIIRTHDYQLLNPELGLMSYLYSYLPNRLAVDIGANTGDVSEYLLKTGYEVYAFEPYPPVFDKLCSRLQHHSGFHPFKLAIGSKDTVMDLHIASDLSGTNKYKDASILNSLVDHSMPLDDLKFTDRISVPVRSLESLHVSMELPVTASILKMDTEGFDLEVIAGMGEYRYPVVITEYWDREMLFGRTVAHNRLDEQVKLMQQRGYHWHIVLYRIVNSDDVSFYCNYSQSVPNSWGNIVFFQNYNLFSQALKWCSSVIPMTYFNSN